MPELIFKGKEFVYNHHLSIPYHPLVPHPEKSIGGEALDGSLVIHGDNLKALKALLPHYAGKVNCIFIDPPYNTGAENWCYNDNVNSPIMRDWFAANPISKDDLLRHDKWLCMMYPRLKLLIELLSPNGLIFVCIDDNELYHLRVILDELLGDGNWIGTIVWKNVTDNNPTRISIEHEYIVCFSKSKNDTPAEWKSAVSDVKTKLIEIGAQLNEQYQDAEMLQAAYSNWFKENKPYLWPLDRYKYIDKGGVYTGSQSVHNPGREGYRYDVIHPIKKKPCKEPLMGYRFPESTMKELLAADKILFGEDETKIIELKVYASEFEDKLPSVIELDGRIAAYELREIFPESKKVFDNPKPSQLVEQILSFVAPPGSVILDSFAGSGTTAHAVLSLNKRDDGKRRFILVEGEDYADEVTAERVRRVIHGASQAQNSLLKSGFGGQFTYCSLGEPLNLDSILTGEALPAYDAIGPWLFHTATGEPLSPSSIKADEWYLGESSAYHVWLIYKSDLTFLKSRDSALTLEVAEKISKARKGKKHLVFAPAKFVPNKMLLPLGVEHVTLPFGLFRIEKS